MKNQNLFSILILTLLLIPTSIFTSHNPYQSHHHNNRSVLGNAGIDQDLASFLERNPQYRIVASVTQAQSRAQVLWNLIYFLQTATPEQLNEYYRQDANQFAQFLRSRHNC